VAELIRHGIDGFIFSQFDDSSGLAEMLKRLHEDEALRQNAGDAAAAAALNWTWDRNATDIWAFLRDAAGRRG
jgi:glycosyltransferase involved in cell wall biosynthesis